MLQPKHALAAAILITSFIGCAASTEPTGPTTQMDTDTEAVTVAQLALMGEAGETTIAAGTFKPYTGTEYPTEPAVYDYSGNQLEGADWLTEISVEAIETYEDDNHGVLIGLNYGTNEVTIHVVDRAALREVGDLGVEMGLNNATHAEGFKDDDEEDVVEMGLSNNIDNRSYDRDTSTSNTALRRLGPLTNTLGGCTAAAFGNRLAFTGAHCAVSAGGATPASTLRLRFIIEANGSATQPYGSATSQTAWFPAAYTAQNCHVVNGFTDACVKYDWAIHRFPSNSLAYGFGFYWASNGTTNNWNIDHGGYPGCSTPYGVPSGCPEPGNVPGTSQANAYRDTSCSSAVPTFQQGSTSNSWPWQDGTDPVIVTGCDFTPGQSGGPLYSSSPGPNGPYIVGNLVRNWCWTADQCTATTEYSTGGVRLSHDLSDYMVSLRSQYP